MTTAILQGKSDRENPRVWFDEGEIASEKPRRGSLLYKKPLSVLAVAMSAAMGVCLSGFATDYNVGSGETMDLGGTTAADARNASANMIVLQAGSTLKLIAENGTASINAKVKVNGLASLDLSAAGSTPTIVGGLRDFGASGAGLRVKGGTLLKINSGTGHFQMSDLMFVDASGQKDDAGKLVFNGGVIIAWPSDCPHEIVSGATIYLCSPTPLFPGDVTLDTFNMWLYNDTSLEKTAKVTVKTGRTLTLKPINYPTWDPSVPIGAVNSNDIVLDGGTLSLQPMPLHYVDGSITGSGTISAGVGNTRGNWLDEAIYFRSSNITFKGKVSFDASHNRLSFAKVSSPGDPENEVVFANANESHLLFQDENGKGPANVTIGKVTANGTSDCILAARGQTISVGDYLNTAAAPGAKSLTSSGEGAVVLPADSYGLAVRQNSTTVEFFAPVANDHSIVDFKGKTPQSILVGTDSRTIANLPSSCAVSAAAGKSVTVFNENGAEINVKEGSVAVSGAWRELPVLWLDASATDTLHGLGMEALPRFKDKVGNDPADIYMTTYTNGLKLVEGWVDWRGRDFYRGFNTRLYNDVNNKNWSPVPQCYPCAVPNGLNGLTYLHFSTYGGAGVSGKPYTNIDGTTLADGSQIRRMPFCQSGTITEARIPATLVTMVFGSQQGGGAAILGTATGAFNRTASTHDASITVNASADVWVNGVKVDPTTTKFSGGWDVITVDATGYEVNGLGWLKDYSTAGGQNYAEVIIYTNAFTSAMRVSAERYLAKKWGLLDRYQGGTEIEKVKVRTQGDAAAVQAVDEVELTLGGRYSGAVTLDGGTLTVDEPLAPAFSELPTQGRVGWFDPDNEDGLYIVNAGAKRPQEVQSVYLNGVYPTAQSPLFLWTPETRRPQWKREARGMGPVRGWMDFNDPEPTAAYTGNSLRPRNYPDTKPEFTGGGTGITVPVKTVLLAMDSSKGGGAPISAGGVNAGRFADDYTAPIWPPQSDTAHHGNLGGVTDTMRNGVTRLDGVQVANPTVTGFNGRPEVLSLTTSTAWNLASFGNISNTEEGRQQGTILGEIFLYSDALSDADRLKVEAYLMDKWIGKLPTGYSDLRSATVAGSGTVSAPDVAQLPKATVGFSGMLKADSATTGFAFTIDGDVLGGAINTPETVYDIPAATPISIKANGKILPGDYTLISCKGFARTMVWQLGFEGKTPRVYELKTVSNGQGGVNVVLSVRAPGLFIVVQ